MIEKILRFSLGFPLVVGSVTLIISIYGFYCLMHLPIDAVPDITNNQVQINTVLPGFSPLQMEKQITYVIETALSGVPGLELTRSISRNGFSQVTAIFEDKVNIYFARQQINERLNEIKENLPDGATPRMGPISTGLGEIYMWTVDFKHPDGLKAEKVDGSPGWQTNGSYLTPEGHYLKTSVEKASYLRTVQDWIIRPQLKGIKGVAGIDSIGGYVRQYHIEPNLERMLALDLSFDEIIQSLKKNNLSIGPGYIEKKGESLLVKSDERLEAPREIEYIVVATRDGIPIRIRDIAEVKIGKEMRTGSATFNGHEAVVGTALMLIGENSRTVAQAVDDKLSEVNRTLPADIIANTVINRTKLVNATVKTVATNLSEGALLVIFILFAFLGYFKAAFIAALVIPISMLMTAIGMTQFNISGNLMSLGAIDFGLIVDGTVIITENCIRRLALKQHELKRDLTFSERKEEVLKSSQEMIQPTVFGQAIIIIVYFPILALTGVEGKMFFPMAITVIFALVSAFILSITFVPAMLSLFMKGHLKERENILVEKSKQFYAPLIHMTLKSPWLTIGSAMFIFFLALLFFYNLGEEFIPTLDEHDMAMHAIRIPSTSLTQSTEMQEEIESALLKIPEVNYVYSKTGTAEVATDPMPPNVSDTFIILKPRDQWPDPKMPKANLIAQVEEAVSKIPGNRYEFTQPIEMRFNELISGVRSDVAVKIYGDDFDHMQHQAEEVAKILSTIPGAADVKVAQTQGLPVLDVKINRENASRLGLNVSDILEVVGIAMGGGHAGQLFEGDRRFDLIVKLPDSAREDSATLSNLPIPLLRPANDKKTNPHQYVTLNEVATLKVSEGLNEIRRENGKRFVAVEANVRGSDLGTFVQTAKQEIQARVRIDQGYWLEWGGQFENLISARNRLVIVVPLCFSLIFLLLYSAFSSIRYALLVFTGVPLALTGGILALWLRDYPFSISAAVGFIALSGIAVLNGLVLITYINQLRDQGIPMDEAIETGALTRLRPVLMTALVASLGFIPMALAQGTGAEVQKPLATVVIGGLISATFLTLLVLPALYQQFSKKTH